MFLRRQALLRAAALVAVLCAASSCGLRRRKYENPITKDTKQPDKILFDKAIGDIEHGRYEVARITLNTLINTYDQSEFLAKSKLAIADSWYREGGSAGMAQAEAEYKDFKLFYPTMTEAAEAQNRVCLIHYRQMEKPDRDLTQALRAEDECRTLLVEFPNSKFAPEAAQRLRNVQESIAEGEFRAGSFYYRKGSNPAAANRFSRLVDQYPLYSKADEALWDLGDAYSKMGSRFRQKSGGAYQKLVRDYPLSDYADAAKGRLKEMELPVPQPDPVALAHMEYEREHRLHEGLLHKSLGFIRTGPNMTAAARSGTPAMSTVAPTVPASVPIPSAGAGAAGFSGDVTASTISGTSALDTNPDARQNPPSTASPAVQTGSQSTTANTAGNAASPGEAPQSAQPAQASDPLPTNRKIEIKARKKKIKKNSKKSAKAAAPDPRAPAAPPRQP